MSLHTSRRLALPAALAAAAIALTACSGTSDKAADEKEISVVATTTQVGDFAKNVIGDTKGVKLTTLLTPNASAHEFDPSAKDLSVISKADLLIENGAHLEEFLDKAEKSAGFKGTLVDTSKGVKLSGEEEEGDDHDGHDHAEGNPHIWTDPNNAKTMVHNIVVALDKKMPGHKAEFDKNAKAYTDKLGSLNDWIKASVDQVPENERTVVSNHDAFHYYLDRYGITFVGSIIPSFEDNAEPSAQQIQQLIDKVKEYKVKAIFSESTINPKDAEAIAKGAGVKVYSGDDALYGDSLGEKGSDGDTYLKATVHNTKLFLESWGKSAKELPKGLDS